MRILFIALLIFTNCFLYSKNSYVQQFGIMMKNGKAQYIDVNKLHEKTPGYMTVAQSTINQYKLKNKKIIKAGKIIWNDNTFETYDTKITNPYYRIIESFKEYYFKIKHNKMFISKDKKKWEILEVSVVNENPKQMDAGKFTAPIYFIIHLKCIWFEGDYEIIGTSG